MQSRPASSTRLVVLEEDPRGRLVATWSDGTVVSGVQPVRAFPWSAPRESVVLVDESGHEVACLSALDELAPDVRTTLERILERLDFVPEIRQILNWSHPYPPCEWSVETDRGRTTITLDSDDDIRKLGTHEALVSDAMGLRYRIGDIERLDPLSRRRLRRLL